MRDEEIEIGDKLRIREWDDMAEEFGVDECGDIETKVWFTTGMRSSCGKPFTVSERYRFDNAEDELCWAYYSREDVEVIDGHSFLITSDMLERATNSDELSDSPEDFDAKFSALFA